MLDTIYNISYSTNIYMKFMVSSKLKSINWMEIYYISPQHQARNWASIKFNLSTFYLNNIKENCKI